MQQSSSRIRVSYVSERIASYVILLITAIAVCVPLALMVIGSLTPQIELAAGNLALNPSDFKFDSFDRLSETGFWGYFKNSVFIAVISSSLSVLVGSTLAYWLARSNKKIQLFSSGSFFILYVFAPVMLVIPYALIFAKLDLTNTIPGIVLAHMSFCLPFCIWSLYDFFRSIPFGLAEMAKADGYTTSEALFRVHLPVALPGLVSTGILAFILSWNEYVFASVLVERGGLRTLPVGIERMFATSYVDWGAILAAGVLMFIPAVIFILVSHRQIKRGHLRGWQ